MRLRLVSRMCAGGPLSIVQLTGGSGITRQAVTKHLHVLAEAGLVRDSREGRERRWEHDAARLGEARRALDVISQQWDHTLGRLREFLERSGG
jgi:DNA-binding transcriptional ArsR family regulator